MGNEASAEAPPRDSNKLGGKQLPSSSSFSGMFTTGAGRGWARAVGDDSTSPNKAYALLGQGDVQGPAVFLSGVDVLEILTARRVAFARIRMMMT